MNTLNPTLTLTLTLTLTSWDGEDCVNTASGCADGCFPSLTLTLTLDLTLKPNPGS